MSLPSKILKTSLQSGRKWLQRPFKALSIEAVEPEVLVPICSLGEQHRADLMQHLLHLNSHDRYLRFGYAANDEHIKTYVERIAFERDNLYGIFNANLHLIAAAHLARMDDQHESAEFGVSVSKNARSQGLGNRLFERAATHARNEGIRKLFIHALSENAPMIKIAKKFGATIERDGSETEAYLVLETPTIDSRLQELISEQFAQANYSLKEDVKRFMDALAGVQEIRAGVRESRHKSAE